MAITTIDNLTEIQSAGANDVLPISTANGVKKIKASALGGGGGAEDFVVEFTIAPDTPPHWTATSETTFAQIYSAYQQGKNIKGIAIATGMFDLIFNVTQISETDVVFLGFIEVTEGEGLHATIRGNSSGYSMYVYQ